MSAAAPVRNPTLSLLSQLGVEDARLEQVAEVMSAFEAQQADTDELAALRAQNQRLKEINQTLLAHSDFLAAAVGACPECWGENAACPECGGQGGPGAFVPERVGFEEIVRPVLDRLRARLAARRRRAPPPPPPTAAPDAKET